jgi:hypothetical protein
MSGATSRRKGAKGQCVAANMLRDRDWVVDQITAGIAAGDLIGTDGNGQTLRRDTASAYQASADASKVSSVALDAGEQDRWHVFMVDSASRRKASGVA